MEVAQTTDKGASCVYLDAQVRVKPLDEGLGFISYGNTVIEADIVHQAMEKSINA